MAMPTIPQGRSQSLPTSALLNNISSRRQSAFQSFGLRRKSEVDIVIDGGDEFIHSYSTFDEISGHVNVRFEKDTPIDDFHIWLQGETNTWVARMAGPSPRSGRATAKHIFMKIQQPIGAVPFSENNIAKAGVRYQIGFKFIVPDRLLPFVCSHKVDHDDVKDQHLQLPPSIGDEMIAGEGQVLMDDLAPAMSKIVYTVRARLAKANNTGRQPDAITESVGIRIIPSRDELPPASVADGPSECVKFQLRTEKSVRKGIFRIGKKQGRLTAETSQPRNIILPRPSRPITVPATTMTTVHLRYDPAASEEQPPQLSSFSTKLKVFTFFGAAPFKSLPAPNKYDVWSIMHGIYPETVNLSSMNLTAVSWKKHETDGSVVSQNVSRRASVATTTTSSKKVTRQTEPNSNPSNGAADLARRPSAFSDNSDISSATSASGTSTTASSPVSSSAQPSFPTITVSPSTSYNPSLPYYTTSIQIPITLPFSSSSSTDQQATSTPIVLSTATGSTTLPLKQKSRTTFLPTFHSCLISRAYALEISLSTQGANAPSLNLRSPIQLTIDPTPTSSSTTAAYPFSQQTNIQASLPAPIEFYDPLSLPSHLQTNPFHLPDYSAGDYNDADSESKANDEAIARALDSDNHFPSSSSSSFSNTPTNALNSNNNNNNSGSTNPMEQIPEYSELQIQCSDSTPIPTSTSTSTPPTSRTPATRRMSTPALLPSRTTDPHRHAPPPATSFSQPPPPPPASAARISEDAPPEYYSSFKRASTLMGLGGANHNSRTGRNGSGSESGSGSDNVAARTGNSGDNMTGSSSSPLFPASSSSVATAVPVASSTGERERKGSRKWSLRS